KPARVVDGRWRTAGFAGLSPSAVRRGFRHRFQREILAQRVAAVGRVLDTTVCLTSCETVGVAARQIRGKAVVHYFDPPYKTEAGVWRTGYSVTPCAGE